ncbi:hypothetical protein [Streptomyces chartreusis]|uniref:hypothetical protein n=1 Tax=Streptomyces chartreusis TaxID=1969 RepID=UPI0036DFA324
MEMGEPERGRRAWHDGLVRRRAAAGLLAGVGLVVLGTVFVVLPGVVVDHDLAGESVAAQDRLKAVNDVRTTLLRWSAAWSCSSERTPPGGNCG